MIYVVLAYRTRRRLAGILTILVLGASPAWGQDTKKKVYVAPDDHTDFIWSDTEAHYEEFFVQMLDYYVAQAKATAQEPPMFQSRFSADGSYWLSVYERKKTPAEFRELVERIKDGHIGCPIVPLVLCYGGMPAEAILRSMYYPGRLERRYGLRFAMAHDMENQTSPYGLGTLWAGAGAKYCWKGVCDCATVVKGLKDREHEIYRWVGQDKSSLIAKWDSLVANDKMGGYAEARAPGSAIEYVTTDAGTNGFGRRYPYDIIGVFGQGWDDKFTTNLLVQEACKAKTGPGRDCIVSDEEDFFRDFEAAYGSRLPVQSLSFGNEWDLAAVSMAEVSARVKRAVEELRAAEGLATLVCLKDPSFMEGRSPERDRAFMDMGLYFEHDFAPGGPGATAAERIAFQRRMAQEIEAYVRKLRGDAADALGGMIEGPAGARRYFVFNPLGWTRTDGVDLPEDGAGEVHVVDLSTGLEAPSQRVTRDGRTTLRVLASEIPSVGYKVFEIRPGVAGGTPGPFADAAQGTLENELYALRVAPRGALTSLQDKHRGGREFVRRIRGYAMNDLDASAGGRLEVENAGPVSATLRASAQATGSNPPHVTRITLYRGLDRIDIENQVTAGFDDAVRTWRFGLEIDQGVTRHEELAAILPVKRASAGGAYSDRNARYDYQTLNHFADLSNDAAGVTLSNADAFFMRVGESSIDTLDDSTPQISPVLGAGGRSLGFDMIRGQAGDSSVLQRFALRCHGAWEAAASMRFALEHQNPLVAARVRGGGKQYPADRYGLVEISDPKVILWALKPCEEGISRGILARMWNLSPSPTAFTLGFSGGIASAMKTTHIETDVAKASVERGKLSGAAEGMQIVSYRLVLP